jgi:hypothetical protein
LTPVKDFDGHSVTLLQSKGIASTSIKVKIDNLCPASGNPTWCRYGKNDAGQETHFDLWVPSLPQTWKDAGVHKMTGNIILEFREVSC